MVRWRPSWPRRDASVGSMIAFGGNIAASYLLMNIDRNADNVLVGWSLGATPLGFYSRAYNLLMLPVRQLSLPITSVAVPAFSRLQNDPERFARYYLRAVNLMMWIGAPVFGFLFVAAEPVISLTLGHQWRPAAPVFKILVISALGQLLLDSTTWLFVSRGRSAQLLRLLFMISPVIVISFAVGLPFGISGVALSGSLILIAMLPWILKSSFAGSSLNLKDLGRAIVYPIAVSVIGVISAEFIEAAIKPRFLLTQLLVTAAVLAGTYAISALLRPVRDEMRSLVTLMTELRMPGNSLEAEA
jgi:O-antigen/teichoic acid export membrane protein